MGPGILPTLYGEPYGLQDCLRAYEGVLVLRLLAPEPELASPEIPSVLQDVDVLRMPEDGGVGHPEDHDAGLIQGPCHMMSEVVARNPSSGALYHTFNRCERKVVHTTCAWYRSLFRTRELQDLMLGLRETGDHFFPIRVVFRAWLAF
jgi:hypothetical protein